jgi:uncharacterized protein YndB with AHSA1/START domain
MSSTSTIDAIVVETTINASAERIFEALTDPAQRIAWWGMKGRFETEHMESDLRAGGRWTMSGVGMGGKPFEIHGVYRTIERPRVLAFTWLPDWDAEATETLVRFDLNEHNGVTTVRLTHSGFASEGSRTRHQGWPQILSWLKSYAEG